MDIALINKFNTKKFLVKAKRKWRVEEINCKLRKRRYMDFKWKMSKVESARRVQTRALCVRNRDRIIKKDGYKYWLLVKSSDKRNGRRR